MEIYTHPITLKNKKDKLMIKTISLLLLFVLSLRADQFFFAFYNDFFAGKDQHFTSGTAFCWLDEKDDNQSAFDFTDFVLDVADRVSINFDSSQHFNAGMSLSQIIITPADTSVATPQYNDIPYAGYLALSTYLFEWDEDSFYEYRLELGIIGEDSFASETQKIFHKAIGNDEPKGWNTQLNTTYTLNTMFRYGEKTWVYKNKKSFDADWFNHAGVTLGNFNTSLFAGTMFRFGQNYIKNFNIHYPYLKEEASLIRLNKKPQWFGYSFNIGFNIETVGCFYILDEAKRQGYSADKRTVNGSVYFGTELYYNSHKVSFFYQSQSPYTKEQKSTDVFGGFMYAYQF